MQFLFFNLLVIFHINETQAINMEGDSIPCMSQISQIFSEETIISSFCYNKKITVYKGEKDHCLFTYNHLKSLFLQLEVNNQRSNALKSTYCVKHGYRQIFGDSSGSSESINYLVYYFVSFNKKDSFMSRYISELQSKSFDVVIPNTQAPVVCYLFMHAGKLIILSLDLSMDMKNKSVIEKIIEKIKE